MQPIFTSNALLLLWLVPASRAGKCFLLHGTTATLCYWQAGVSLKLAICPARTSSAALGFIVCRCKYAYAPALCGIAEIVAIVSLHCVWLLNNRMKADIAAAYGNQKS